MSYTTPDFADDVQSLLGNLGYAVRRREDIDAFTWSFGDYEADTDADSEQWAWIGALHDFVERTLELRSAAGHVLLNWSRADLARHVRELEERLNACIAEPLPDFLRSLQEPDEELPHKPSRPLGS